MCIYVGMMYVCVCTCLWMKTSTCVPCLFLEVRGHPQCLCLPSCLRQGLFIVCSCVHQTSWGLSRLPPCCGVLGLQTHITAYSILGFPWVLESQIHGLTHVQQALTQSYCPSLDTNEFKLIFFLHVSRCVCVYHRICVEARGHPWVSSTGCHPPFETGSLLDLELTE